MPELPEVETMRRGIAAVVGCKINEAAQPPCAFRPITLEPPLPALRAQVRGTTISAVSRAGKRVVVELNSGSKLVIEPRMTGLVLVANPPDWEHLRLRLALTGGGVRELLFWDRRGLGTVRLLSAAEFQSRLGADHLGPDALEVSAADLRAQLGNSRRAIKVALLDQRAVAGIGNLYASEILHLAAIHPAKPCGQLTRQQWQRLQTSARDVLETAILHEGSTLSDGTYRNALNQQGSYQNHHRVYDRAGELCGTCGKAEIIRIVQAQRSTFYCPRCQRRR